MNRGSKQPGWKDMVDAVAGYADLHGRWPRPGGPGREARLATWLDNQRQFAPENAVNNLILPLPRRAYLELVTPGWQDPEPAERSTHDKWRTIADKHILLAQRLGRQPRSSAKVTVDERTSASWFIRQRRLLLAGHPTRATLMRRGYLDFHLPEWRGTYPPASEDPPLMPEQPPGEDHLLEASVSVEFDVVAAAERRRSKLGEPLLPGTATDDVEQLIRVLDGRRNHRNVSNAEHQRILELDRIEPLWRFGLVWMTKAEQVAEFYFATGRWPRCSGAERPLGTWLVTQRQFAAGRRRQFLDVFIPGWDDGVEAKWHSKADAVGRFKEETGRWPALNGPTPVERQLAKWLNDQRRAQKYPHLQRSASFTNRRRGYLTQVAPGWETPDELTPSRPRARSVPQTWRERIDQAIAARGAT